MAEAAISEYRQELVPPVKDSIEAFSRLFYILGTVTHPSAIKVPKDDPAVEIQRSLITRSVRKELLAKFKHLPKEDKAGRAGIIAEAHEWDRLGKEFLNQAEVSVEIPLLGKQKSRINIMKPKDSKNGEVPIFMIPGISNDLDCVAYIAQALAKSGRTVITVAHPESFMGETTKEFEDAVSLQNDFKSHADFFKAVLEKFVSSGSSVELWGLSTGAPIAAKMLNEEAVQGRVARAVFLSPAGCVAQSDTSLRMGIVQDTVKTLMHYSDIMPKFVMTEARKNGAIAELGQRRKRIMKKIFELTENNNSDKWKNMRVNEDGNIVVLVGGKDNITKSYKAGEVFGQNLQVDFAIMPNECHSTSFNNPAVLEKIFSLQR